MFNRQTPSLVIGLAGFFCGLWPAVACATPLATVRVAAGLNDPLFVTHAPGDFDRIFIVERSGRIKILKNGVVLLSAFLDLAPDLTSGGEQGLLGLAFHPDYQTNGAFFVNYTDTSGRTVVARYGVSADPDVADATEEILLRIAQPFENHNGGWIGFGPDGYLYVAMGDGGDRNDPGNRAQDTQNQLLGKILRIDVDGDDFPGDALRNYAIPPDNPFVGQVEDDEIWAYGLRNPWRCSFDRQTGDLYIGDVGQDAREEINFQPASSLGGENYGWRCMEGMSCTGLSGCTCNDASLTLPVHDYVHGPPSCNSVTGGYVYRGSAIAGLAGTYFFAEFCKGQIWSFRMSGGSVVDFQERTSELAPIVGAIELPSSFGEDAFGELYICDLADGEVYKIVSSIPVPTVSECGAIGLFVLLFCAAATVMARHPRRPDPS
ncbi:MAG: PQQ-dependent sugar dehydrogenase [Planctomycetes bacterium]|nr:PQQ-dependent sugar dehydrogenase [Planctomycetota bacterium]